MFCIFVCGLFIGSIFGILIVLLRNKAIFFAYRGKFIRQIFAYVGYYCYLCSMIILFNYLKYQL